MLSMLWNLSAAIRGYLRFYMPTNRAIDWLRTERGLKWAVLAAIMVLIILAAAWKRAFGFG